MKTLTPLLLLALALPLIAADAPPAAPAATDAPSTRASILLKSGARISADVLRKRDDGGLIVDLGLQTITLSSAEVLSTQTETTKENPIVTDDKALYIKTSEASRPAPMLTAALADKYGDSIIMVRTPRGLGSGFFISKEGFLLTNYHVVEQETRLSIEVHTQDKEGGKHKQELHKVRIVALQPLRDLALLQIDLDEAKSINYAPLALPLNGTDDLKKGDLVVAIGNPLGLERSVTQGIISSTNRNMGNLRMLQTDVAINPGNSGGPMLNNRGEIVGMTCAGSTQFHGLAFGIPVEDIIQFLNHHETFLFDQTQPQNGAVYLDPPSIK